ncbi:hypothetical protein [Streptomyces sp. IBSNAI001]|uniref:hypothetical protein n=1 Tax=Streptomyces sp. IBSNAI001 TaxID=3457499 RepID=UPI003FD1C286
MRVHVDRAPSGAVGQTSVVRHGRTRGQIADDIEAGPAGIAPLGRLAPAEPDPVERLRIDSPPNEIDPATPYGGGKAGYTDHPPLAHA